MPTRSKANSSAAAAALIALAVALGGVQAARTATTAPSGSPEELLRQAITADDRVSYSGTITTLVYGPHRADATVVRVEHRSPNKWRMWYVAPADAYGRLIVSNEKTTYQYEPKVATVYSDDFTHSPALMLDFDVAKVLKNYTVDAGPAKTVAGRRTTSLSLVSRYTGETVQRVWIDEATRLVLQREIYHADGSVDTKTTFDDIRFVTDLPKALFDLTVPAGMHVEQGTSFGAAVGDLSSAQSGVPFSIEKPDYVPDGFTLDRASLGERNGVRTVQLLYTDGLRDFSVFENDTQRLPDLASPEDIQVDDASGVTDEIAGETLLSWNADGLNITLVGDMPAKLLAKIGASVRR